MNVSDANKNPLTEYFVEAKFDLWLKYCEILSDAHDRITQMVVTGYLPDFKKIAIEKIAGEIVFRSLEGTRFLFDLKAQRELVQLISRAASNKPVCI
jgi:hypothetical protein